MSEIRRINFYGGPGCSKSTIATGIFSELKKLNFDIEYVNEYIKTWAYQKKVPKDFDQLYVFGKQVYYESRLMPHVKHVITDSPILLNIAYAKKYNCSYADNCLKIALQYEEEYPGLHIYLDRTGLPYITEGRYENLEEAKFMDDYIYNLLANNKIPFHMFYSTDKDRVLDFIKGKLNG